MDIASKKIELIHLLIDESKASVLSEIEAILLHSLSKKEKKIIDEAYKSLEDNPAQEHNLVMEETKKRYSKYFKK